MMVGMVQIVYSSQRMSGDFLSRLNHMAEWARDPLLIWCNMMMMTWYMLILHFIVACWHKLLSWSWLYLSLIKCKWKMDELRTAVKLAVVVRGHPWWRIIAKILGFFFCCSVYISTCSSHNLFFFTIPSHFFLIIQLWHKSLYM